MVNEVADSEVKWERLGTSLGLGNRDIDMIKQYDQHEHHQRLVEMWYDRDLECSLFKLRREMDKLHLRRGSSASVSSLQPESSGKPLDNITASQQDVLCIAQMLNHR